MHTKWAVNIDDKFEQEHFRPRPKKGDPISSLTARQSKNGTGNINIMLMEFYNLFYCV